jgi:DNA/RNA endonuclease YhcR with UshA esterase domain
MLAMIRRALILFAVISSISISAHAANLTPPEAQKHIGETATVCGTVASARYADRSKGSPTFLNLGHAYPNEDFTAVIWGENRSKFGTPENLAGQSICVTGPLTLYRGKPEMVLRDKSQLKH